MYIYRQRLERLKQYKRRRYDIDIGPLTREGTITGTEWKTKKRQIKQEFIWALVQEVTIQIT